MGAKYWCPTLSKWQTLIISRSVSSQTVAAITEACTSSSHSKVPLRRREEGKNSSALTKKLFKIDSFQEREVFLWRANTGYVGQIPWQAPCSRVVGQPKSNSMSFCFSFLFKREKEHKVHRVVSCLGEGLGGAPGTGKNIIKIYFMKFSKNR